MPTSSSSSGPIVELRLQPSQRLLRAAVLLHAGCLILLLLAEPPTVPMLGLAFAIGASWLWVRRHPALGFGAGAIDRMLVHADGSWTLQAGNGEPFEAQLLDETVVRGPLLVLRLRAADGRVHTRALAGDEAPPEMLRRLRARLMSQ
jgi:toxin CptA